MRDFEFVLYVLRGCPYCEGAIKLLTQKHVKHQIITVPPSQKEQVKRQNNMSTFPQIFLRERAAKGTERIRLIGGYSDLQRLFLE